MDVIIKQEDNLDKKTLGDFITRVIVDGELVAKFITFEQKVGMIRAESFLKSLKAIKEEFNR